MLGYFFFFQLPPPPPPRVSYKIFHLFLKKHSDLEVFFLFFLNLVFFIRTFTYELD